MIVIDAVDAYRHAMMFEVKTLENSKLHTNAEMQIKTNSMAKSG